MSSPTPAGVLLVDSSIIADIPIAHLQQILQSFRTRFSTLSTAQPSVIAYHFNTQPSLLHSSLLMGTLSNYYTDIFPQVLIGSLNPNYTPHTPQSPLFVHHLLHNANPAPSPNHIDLSTLCGRPYAMLANSAQSATFADTQIASAATLCGLTLSCSLSARLPSGRFTTPADLPFPYRATPVRFLHRRSRPGVNPHTPANFTRLGQALASALHHSTSCLSLS